MRRARLGLALGLMTLAAACSPAARDIAYYRAHADARAQELALCDTKAGTSKADPDCIAALAADRAALSKTFWTVPATPSRVQDPAHL